MAYSQHIREEELKNKVAIDFFQSFDTTQILGNIDFCVAIPSKQPQLFETEYLLWAEAKKGNKASIEESFVQLIITIGKARTFEHHLPPRFLGAFDTDKIAFIPYNDVLEVFYQNDFNWNVTPSDHSTKEFKLILSKVKEILNSDVLIYNYTRDKKDLERFIKRNFIVGKTGVTKIRISKNNFVSIYQKWLLEVKPTIDVNWELAKKNGIIDADFYLADILSEHNVSLREKLFVLLRESYYELDRKTNDLGLFTSSKASFTDEQKAHAQFWNRYNRPPKREYWDYIVERRDLLVTPDVRERKGSFFTPQKWVELSQQYLAEELGENWQDEYYIWDCAAGTGNLLNGLTNKYNIWASTLDKADVDIMKERAKNGSANLLEEHIFQFDFLNDPFDKLPLKLREIISQEESRKKLVIYINPPYAEAGNSKQLSGIGKNKTNVAISHNTYKKYINKIGIAGRELFAQFFMRIYDEIPSSVLAEFSTLKILQAPNFRDFRKIFRAKLGRIFLVPADTFDNVKGSFPIGFHIWRLDKQEEFTNTFCDVYDSKGNFIGHKYLEANDNSKTLTDWIISTRNRPGEKIIGFNYSAANDIQHNNYNRIETSKDILPSPRGSFVTSHNLIESSIYIAVRKVVNQSWLNDRDQYLYPNNEWIQDPIFQNDCLAFTIFNNNIQSRHGINHWIPFKEDEVGARDCFKSHFMTDYISGRNRPNEENSLFASAESTNDTLEFSKEAIDVFDAGRALWRYYHSQPDSNPDASLYEIRLYFQGTKLLKNGKVQMKSDSNDETYMTLIRNLRDKLKILASKIEPKVYEYGFLKK
ncbi:hypothetical protein [uncultured Duncaniella sp.]|uniref:hypothetical protein n=2 Tax=uncultured Duncaniella sp. TaxID=2768039 RepID=UPI0026182B39|nr:hypothetical protein [uncultured Duncaniella sp.]